MLLEGDPQRLQPRVQCPWDTWERVGRAWRGGEGETENNHNRRCVFIWKLAFPQDITKLRDQETWDEYSQGSLYFFSPPDDLQMLKLKITIQFP